MKTTRGLSTLTGALVGLVLLAMPTAGKATVVADGGFEAGQFGGVWTESSTNFGTPICSVADCGSGGGTGPNTGTFWAWFGGIRDAVEDSFVSQDLIIPIEKHKLTFVLEIPVVDTANDFLEVLLDGVSVFLVDGSATILNYVQIVVDVSAFADGALHTLEFHSVTFSALGGPTNFFVDDVSFVPEPSTLAIFGLGLAGLGFFMTRRRRVV